MNNSRRTPGRDRAAALKIGFAAVSLIGMAACKSTFNDIIAVSPGDRVSETVLFNDPNQAALLTSSAQGQFECSYGDYVLTKIGKVFPQLKRAVL